MTRVLTLLIVVVCFAACSKKDAAVVKHFPTIIDSSRVSDTGVRSNASLYPYCDTFYGPYQEYSADLEPNQLTGFSTVWVWHLTADSINIQSVTIGAQPYSQKYNTYINSSMRLTGAAPWAVNLSVRWWSDRSDFYTCKLYADSLVCNIDQEGGECATDYLGTYTGVLVGAHH